MEEIEFVAEDYLVVEKAALIRLRNLDLGHFNICHTLDTWGILTAGVPSLAVTAPLTTPVGVVDGHEGGTLDESGDSGFVKEGLERSLMVCQIYF